MHDLTNGSDLARMLECACNPENAQKTWDNFTPYQKLSAIHAMYTQQDVHIDYLIAWVAKRYCK